MPWAIEQKIFIVEAYFRQKSIHAAQLQFKEPFGYREFSVHSMIYRWVNKFRTHETVQNLNRKDTNRQSHWTTEIIKDTTQRCCCQRLLSTAQVNLCVSEVRCLESTGSLCREFRSHISTCILTGYRLNKSLHLTTRGSEWSYASGFTTRLTLCQTFLTMSGFRTKHIFCCQVTWTLRTTSSGVAHPLSTVCKGHYTLWSALPGLPSPNMTSLDHSGFEDDNKRSVTINTERYVQVLNKFWTALGRWRGSSGSTSGSSRMVPPPTLEMNHWLGYKAFPWLTNQPQVWPAVVAAFTGLEPPRFLSVGIP